jgi:hypothetical protein
MTIEQFLTQLKSTPESITFPDTIAVIDQHFSFTPTAFQNGNLTNNANQNSGSCKLFSFAQMQGLTQQETLQCFGDFYRKDVLLNPEGDDHQNIRNFIQFGWDGVIFNGDALQPINT